MRLIKEKVWRNQTMVLYSDFRNNVHKCLIRKVNDKIWHSVWRVVNLRMSDNVWVDIDEIS